MDKVVFNNIMQSVLGLKDEVYKWVDDFDAKTLYDLSEKEYKKALSKSQSMQSKLDNLNNDLYHIIGMGHLTSAQQSIYLKEYANIVKRRDEVKRIVNIYNLTSQIRIAMNPECNSEYTLVYGKSKLNLKKETL